MESLENGEELPIIWKHDKPVSYEQSRVGRVFNNRRPKRFPRAIVEATCEKHIVDAVKLAQKLNCRVSVRSGGHSWAVWSVREDAVLIDLGKYNHLSLDKTHGIVEASPSTTGRILNKFLGQQGYIFCGGHCPDVGIGGFLLQGGMGWNCKNWGWACEKIRAVDIVTADGNLLHCNANENSELYWLARGAGPGFPAIVSKFYLEVRKSFEWMMYSFFAYPKSRTREILEWVRNISRGYDQDTEIVAVSQYLPAESDHVICALFLAFKNSSEKAQAALESANLTRPSGCLEEIMNCPTNLDEQYINQGAANPEGHRYCVDNAYISNEMDVATVLEPAFTTLPSKKAFSLYFSMTPTSRRQLPDMALSMQSDHYFATYVVWEDESEDEKCMEWVRSVMKPIERISDGAYLGDSDFQSRRTKYWSDENAQKVMQLRRKWDPEGRICGYLDINDSSGVKGLKNEHEWLGTDSNATQ